MPFIKAGWWLRTEVSSFASEAMNLLKRILTYEHLEKEHVKSATECMAEHMWRGRNMTEDYENLKSSYDQLLAAQSIENEMMRTAVEALKEIEGNGESEWCFWRAQQALAKIESLKRGKEC
jgi:hypothetical protein